MIAVFTRSGRDFKDLELTPRKMFRRITSIDDIRGVKFLGILKTYKWWESRQIEEAYDHLKSRHPELFD